MIHIKFCPLSRRFALATLVAMAMVSPGANAQTGPQKLPTTQLTAGMHLIRAEVADDDGERQIGLMHRPSMGASDGMVFVFEQPGVQCFWMRNTLIPLSAAFIDDSGTIVNIEDMKPQSDDSHCSKKPVRFVLEMNKGWFDKRGLKAGSVIGGAVFKPAAAR
ncbi:DUF192 domain-containing protein [Sphaerotilus montanus]|uniref:DUF192 domain-containing protein n=1 Tax=Sphaerotilus montanus TaxID=522889 RepID=A0A7Y9QW25_9BURK|nr:DUF192 domain-containing protein [Sphaerotilus montanus]NYG31149.1 hypothetical protein [Sphaerotilus montanus]NZD55135.1 DUF192 domain-containing protein [Sphaerotilus montanus]